MIKNNTQIPAHYEQPSGNFTGRTFINSIEEDVDYLQDSNLRIWYNTQPENYLLHHHDALEIILCKENQYAVTVNGKLNLLNEGDILFIPSHMLHEIQAQGIGSRFIFLINVDVLNALKDFKTMIPISTEPYLCSSSLHPQIYRQLYSTLMQIVDTYFSNVFLWETTIYSLLLQAFSLIGRDYSQSDSSDFDSFENKQREHYEKFSALLDYINKCYMDEITLEQAAEHIGFSKFHFSRLFKLYTNTSFYEYLSQKRVSAAQALLSTNLSITDIAFQTGFNNLTTFCRCFKKYTGYTPSEYRDKYIKGLPIH